MKLAARINKAFFFSLSFSFLLPHSFFLLFQVKHLSSNYQVFVVQCNTFKGACSFFFFMCCLIHCRSIIHTVQFPNFDFSHNVVNDLIASGLIIDQRMNSSYYGGHDKHKNLTSINFTGYYLSKWLDIWKSVLTVFEAV